MTFATKYRIILLLIFLLQFSTVHAENFPVFDSMKPNVAFWVDIYSKYTTKQTVVHDRISLNMVYDVLAMDSGNTRANKRRTKKALKKYTAIFRKLAKGKKPVTADEKRVAKMFGKTATSKTFRKAIKNLRFQRGQKDRFIKGVKRSGAYIKRIKVLFKAHGLPTDLAYLPHVESSFNPKAYSKYGAAGMWQFTYSTGKRFMTINYTVDERRDPIFSSIAAAKLLKDNYSKLGDWPMALTAYNHGVNGMMRARNQKGSYKKIFKKYNGRRFKFASRNFYSEFIAARQVAKNYKKYFGHIKFSKPENTKNIKLKGFTPVASLSKALNIKVKTIKTLNPSLRRPVFSGQKYIPGGFMLRLPNNKLSAYKIPHKIYKKKQKRSLFYRVRRGDTASSIARNHKIPLKDLIIANNLNRRATIYAGQNLRLPVPGEKRILVASTKKNNKTGLKKSTITTKKIKTASKKLPADSAKTVAPAKSVALNQIAEIKDKDRINTNVVSGNFSITQLTKKNGNTVGTISVQVAETLGHYADWLGIPTQSIRDINRLKFGKVIKFNQKIKIPLKGISKNDFEEKRFEFHKEMEEDFFESFKIEEVNQYIVKKGDSVWSLYQNVFDIPFWLLAKYNNGMNFDNLKYGQKISVAIVEKI